tara:strand:+ start:2302 stop:2787 length:486 start_codon:yes stop_codon:yes gene_type:complete
MNLHKNTKNYTAEDHLKWTQDIAKHIHNMVDNKQFGVQNWWKGHYPSNGPDPYRGQTEKGLILEEYYGMPYYIHTPIGSWSILGSGTGDYKELMNTLKKDLSLVLFKEVVNNNWGIIGPYWKITKFNGFNFPNPEWKTKSLTYAESQKIYTDFIKGLNNIN